MSLSPKATAYEHHTSPPNQESAHLCLGMASADLRAFAILRLIGLAHLPIPALIPTLGIVSGLRTAARQKRSLSLTCMSRAVTRKTLQLSARGESIGAHLRPKNLRSNNDRARTSSALRSRMHTRPTVLRQIHSRARAKKASI